MTKICIYAPFPLLLMFVNIVLLIFVLFSNFEAKRAKNGAKKKKSISKCVLDLKFAPIKGSVLLIKKKVKFVVPYCSSHFSWYRYLSAYATEHLASWQHREFFDGDLRAQPLTAILMDDFSSFVMFLVYLQLFCFIWVKGKIPVVFSCLIDCSLPKLPTTFFFLKNLDIPVRVRYVNQFLMVLMRGSQENTDTQACRFHGKNIRYLCNSITVHEKLMNNEKLDVVK
jgi:hypothetical protein